MLRWLGRIVCGGAHYPVVLLHQFFMTGGISIPGILNLPRFSGHVHSFDLISRQEVFDEERSARYGEEFRREAVRPPDSGREAVE